MEHQFNVEIAKLVGVNAAIIFKNISHWCEKNKANEKHFYDGKYWTYNSLSAFEKLFPYLSVKQIKTALDKLKQEGFIDFGEYNSNPWDRTRWYCDLTQKVPLNAFPPNVPKGTMDSAKRDNVHDALWSPSITYSNTYSKPDNKHLNINTETSSVKNQTDLFSSQESDKTLVEKKRGAAAKKKSETNPSVNLIKHYWFEEFRISDKPTSSNGWAIKISKIKSISEKIISFIESSTGELPNEHEVLDFFKVLSITCANSKNTFYSTISLDNIDSKFSSVVELAKSSLNKQENGTKQFKSKSDYISEGIMHFSNL